VPTDILSIASAFKDVAFSTALIILLYGGAKRWWVFGYQLTEAQAREDACKAEYQARLDAAMKREDQWKELALNGGYIARQAVEIARDRRPATRDRS
jgi:hypothetical protein